MKKIDLARKFLTLKTEVSGATFNDNDVRRYATKNKVEDLLDLIKKAEAALESLKCKEKIKINDYLSNEGAEKKSEVEALKKNTYAELKNINASYSKSISETIKARLSSNMVETNIGHNVFEIGISDGNGRIKGMKRFDIYFSDWGSKPSVELSHLSGRFSLVPGETDSEDIELISIMNELLHNMSLVGLLIETRNKWKKEENKMWRRIEKCEAWLKNPFEAEFPMF